jgi:peptidoglycan/xylan/chitin deacetylase (PgdA/CDA1 family)
MRGLAEMHFAIPARAEALERIGECSAGAAGAGLLLPVVLGGAPVHSGAVVASLAVLLGAAIAWVTWRFGGRALPATLIGAAAVVLAAFLMNSASYPGSGFVVAVLLGAGTGVLVPRRLQPAYAVPGVIAGAALAGAAWAAWGTAGAAAVVATIAIVASVVAVSHQHGLDERRSAVTRSLAGATVVYGLFAVFWVGSTAPAVAWFGSLTSHGPRDRNEVAITFDDGPNPPFTLEIADILEEHGVRGTFFEVGKAVVQRPDVTKALIERGHMVGNHSYYHGAFSYLDPWYPELEQTQKAFKQSVGVCPAVFRPPHGTHTPFMSQIIDDHGMTLVTWDVSALDWVETDGAVVAANVLAKVKPGSIILLHDGIDGNIGADRSVLLKALPEILDGLAKKGLTPVTLDKLLGVPALLPGC